MYDACMHTYVLTPTAGIYLFIVGKLEPSPNTIERTEARAQKARLYSYLKWII